MSAGGAFSRTGSRKRRGAGRQTDPFEITIKNNKTGKRIPVLTLND